MEIQCSPKYSSNDLCMGIRPIVLTAARELRILCLHGMAMTEEHALCFSSSTSTMVRRAHRRARAKTAQTSRSAHKCVYMSFTSKPSDSIDTEKRSLSMDKICSLTRSIEWNSYVASPQRVCVWVYCVPKLIRRMIRGRYINCEGIRNIIFNRKRNEEHSGIPFHCTYPAIIPFATSEIYCVAYLLCTVPRCVQWILHSLILPPSDSTFESKSWK